jgi:NADPH2:quinone reductase
MAMAIRLSERGGPEVLKWEQVEVGAPAAGEVLLQQSAIGVNFADVYLRTGLYPQPLPSGIGSEAAGVVAAVGMKVRGLKPGARVVYTYPKAGAYARPRRSCSRGSPAGSCCARRTRCSAATCCSSRRRPAASD